ncbi:cis-aconitate decarboxylase [Mesoplodon densirostris]|uniref:cis-aconitate decarboxylase n=1 Tax=Mesoplodon densirostris TaxID=48708 RepID=UPI0028DB49E7|nr:cis-aconitate decarboxylase [Mesoplodon densirostris]
MAKGELGLRVLVHLKARSSSLPVLSLRTRIRPSQCSTQASSAEKASLTSQNLSSLRGKTTPNLLTVASSVPGLVPEDRWDAWTWKKIRELQGAENETETENCSRNPENQECSSQQQEDDQYGISKEEQSKKANKGKILHLRKTKEKYPSCGTGMSTFPKVLSVTESFAKVIHGLKVGHLTDRVIQRSKRMILDTLGVGFLGTGTEVFRKAREYSKIYTSNVSSTVWGQPDFRLPPTYAAFLNGVAIHSMDFDDTWYPATHPSGAVLPVLMALSEALPPSSKCSGLDLLLAFNVGIEVQGRLMHFSKEAKDIPKRFHPPSVVGTLGSAAAASKFLGLSMTECQEALAIAVSHAGAPMANAATQTKPLHVGNAARHGLEAAFLARLGLQGNKQVLDMESGFGAFYANYAPNILPDVDSHTWLLDQQDVAFKLFPAHLATHWVADAAASVRKHLVRDRALLPTDHTERIVLRIPDVRYVNRPFPDAEPEARHSFQYVACATLLDGAVTVSSFHKHQVNRPRVRELLGKVELEHPRDNLPNFNTLYCEISVALKDGSLFTERSDTFYGHWRKPLSQKDLQEKFRANACRMLSCHTAERLIEIVENLEYLEDCSMLTALLKEPSPPEMIVSKSL